MREPRQVVSLSGGKDSTALLLMMLEREEKVDEAVMFDGGWEFPEMHEHIERLRRFIDVPITILKPPHPLEWYMTEYLIKKGKRKGEFGYGFPRPYARWCTRIKTSTISRYLCSNETVCIGIAADEDRPLSSDFRYPLVEWGVTEKEALAYCLSHGFDWGGLYEHMDGVSCWCCPLQGLDSARALRKTHPELWTRLLEMERACEVFPDTFRIDYSAAQLEKRFAEEDAQTQLELFEERTYMSGFTAGMRTSKSSEWRTPPELFAELDREFGFDLDVASTHENALCERHYTIAEDGLVQPWTGTIWCNPPYGREIAKWVRKAAESNEEGVSVLLLPAQTDTAWWHDCVLSCATEIRYIRGRLKFSGSKHGAPFPSAIAIYDKRNMKGSST